MEQFRIATPFEQWFILKECKLIVNNTKEN